MNGGSYDPAERRRQHRVSVDKMAGIRERRDADATTEGSNSDLARLYKRGGSWVVVIGNRKMTLIQWCEELDLNHSAVSARLRYGSSIWDALNTPTRSGFVKRTQKVEYMRRRRARLQFKEPRLLLAA